MLLIAPDDGAGLKSGEISPLPSSFATGTPKRVRVRRPPAGAVFGLSGLEESPSAQVRRYPSCFAGGTTASSNPSLLSSMYTTLPSLLTLPDASDVTNDFCACRPTESCTETPPLAPATSPDMALPGPKLCI